MRLTFTLILVLLVAVVIAIFSGQNSMELTVRFLHWQVTTSLVAVIVFAVAAGGLLVGLPSMFRMAMMRVHERELSGKLMRAEREKAELETQVLTLRSEMGVRERMEKDVSSRSPKPRSEPPTEGDNP